MSSGIGLSGGSQWNASSSTSSHAGAHGASGQPPPFLLDADLISAHAQASYDNSGSASSTAAPITSTPWLTVFSGVADGIQQHTSEEAGLNSLGGKLNDGQVLQSVERVQRAVGAYSLARESGENGSSSDANEEQDGVSAEEVGRAAALLALKAFLSSKEASSVSDVHAALVGAAMARAARILDEKTQQGVKIGSPEAGLEINEVAIRTAAETSIGLMLKDPSFASTGSLSSSQSTHNRSVSTSGQGPQPVASPRARVEGRSASTSNPIRPALPVLKSDPHRNLSKATLYHHSDPRSSSGDAPPRQGQVDYFGLSSLSMEMVSTLAASTMIARKRRNKVFEDMREAGLAVNQEVGSEETELLRRLESVGATAGHGFADRLLLDRQQPAPNSTLEVLKFVCKEVWTASFEKQVDHLRTNHKGVYVLQDNHFKPLRHISAPLGLSESAQAAKIVRGELQRAKRGVVTVLGG